MTRLRVQHQHALSVAREQPPRPGEHLELVDGITWIRLPIPGGLDHVNVWLLPATDGAWLVDCGMFTPPVEAVWQRLGPELALDRRLRGIIVTHHHPDHFGMAARLSRRYGVPVHMTPPALDAATGTQAGGEAAASSGPEGFAQRTGLVTDPAAVPILRGETYRAIISGTVSEIVPLAEGSCIPGAAYDWSVSVHHGHAPGHACLYAADAGLLVSGDQVLPTISSNISLYPSNEQSDPLAEFLASLDRLGELPHDTLVLPAHGRPFATLHARLDALRAEHARRLEGILAACGQPASTTEVVSSQFKIERLDTLNRLLATTETLAHLRYLELRGQVMRSGLGAGLRWRAS